MGRFIAAVVAGAVLAAGNVSAQEAVSGALVSDIDVRIQDDDSYVVFYDDAGRPCATSGEIVIYKKVIRFRDQVKMEGRGIDQQFVRERVPYEDYGIAVRKGFTASDFKERRTAGGRTLVVLPLALPGVSRGESVRVVFGDIEKTVTAGY